MSSFCASLELKPRLQPKEQDLVPYEQGPSGVSIDIRCVVNGDFQPTSINNGCRGLFYSYPGSAEPALKDINLSLNAGETLAIVGLNGSGTSFAPSNVDRGRNANFRQIHSC